MVYQSREADIALTLQFIGELAEDSLDVPSYRPGFISGDIRYGWLSQELSYCPAVILGIFGSVTLENAG